MDDGDCGCGRRSGVLGSRRGIRSYVVACGRNDGVEWSELRIHQGRGEDFECCGKGQRRDIIAHKTTRSGVCFRSYTSR